MSKYSQLEKGFSLIFVIVGVALLSLGVGTIYFISNETQIQGQSNNGNPWDNTEGEVCDWTGCRESEINKKFNYYLNMAVENKNPKYCDNVDAFDSGDTGIAKKEFAKKYCINSYILRTKDVDLCLQQSDQACLLALSRNEKEFYCGLTSNLEYKQKCFDELLNYNTTELNSYKGIEDYKKHEVLYFKNGEMLWSNPIEISNGRVVFFQNSSYECDEIEDPPLTVLFHPNVLDYIKTNMDPAKAEAIAGYTFVEGCTINGEEIEFRYFKYVL